MPTTVQTCETLSERLSAVVLKRPTKLGWFTCLAISFTGVLMLNVAISWLLLRTQV